MMGKRNRLDLVRNKAFILSREEGGVKVVLSLPLEMDVTVLLSRAVDHNLISLPEKKSDKSFTEMISGAIADGIRLIITSQARLDNNESWLHDPINNFVKKGQKLNEISVLDIPSYAQLLTLGNCFGSITPKLVDKVKTTEFMISVGQIIGQEKPRLAVLAAVEVVYPQMSVTCDGAVLAKMSDRGQIKNGLVDGPLSLDVAVDPEVANSKGVVGSAVAGQAQGFLTPDAATARGIWEASVKFGGAGFGSLILGGAIPILSISGLDNPESAFNSVCLARLML